MLWVPATALAATGFYFRGYDSENITSYTFAYAAMGASVSGTDVTMQPGASEGVAVGLIAGRKATTSRLPSILADWKSTFQH
ncbi:MAG: hypothetical protein R2881_01755 [Eubacteriales bacterium]